MPLCSTASRETAASLPPASRSFTRTFDVPGHFAALAAAVLFLEQRGFSIGTNQHDAPTGLIHGPCRIAKWRNLSIRERAELHGVITGDSRTGPLTVTIYPTAPAAAIAAFQRETVDA